MTEIEATINSYPITYIGNDLPEDIITPNHFLRAQFPRIPSNETITETTCTQRLVHKVWQRPTKIQDKFWKHISKASSLFSTCSM